MSRKRNQGSEKSPSREEKDKNKRTTSNTLSLQTPANADEWEAELHPSPSPQATPNDNRPAELWRSEVATMTRQPATIDATVETDAIPRQRRRKNEPKGNEEASEVSTSNNEGKVDPEQPARLILVSAPPKLVDVGTDPPKLRRKRNQRSSSEPGANTAPAVGPPLTAFNSVPTVVTLPESEIEEELDTRNYDSSTMDYDLDEYEPLTTKVTKIYKKRPNRVVPIDSDDSFDDWPIDSARINRMTIVSEQATPTQYAESEIPHSGETSPNMGLLGASTTDMYTSSEAGNRTQNEDSHLTDHGMGGFSLLSGRAFIYMVIPPDGGFGWVILILSFLAQLIVDGIIFSIGILLPYMSTEFDVSMAQIALVASVQIGCYFTGGAFSSALINSWGFRPVALLGVLVSALAILIASFSTNFWMMIVFYSLIGGPGLSMIWVSSQLIIGYYFERYRPVANGFSCSGAGAGIVVIPIMITYLALEIGWRNALRVQVVLILLIVFMALAYVEVAPTQVGIVHRPEYNTSSSDEFYGNFYVHNFLRDEEPRKSPTKIDPYEPPIESDQKTNWALRCSPCCARKQRYTTTTTRSSKALSRRSSERNFVVRPDPLEKDDLFYTGPVEYEEPHHIEQLDGKELELVGSEKYIQQVAYGLHNIHNDEVKDNSRRGSPELPKKQDNRFHSKLMRAFGRLFAVHLFSSFEFRLLVLASFLYPIGFNIPFVYSKARADIPAEYGTMIGPCIGLSNFIIRITCGFVAFKVKSWTTYLCGGGMVFGGFAVFVSAFYGINMIWFQMLYGLCYGVAPAVYSTLRAIIYVRYLGLSNLTNAFGLTALAMGLGVFIGTSIGGVLVDQTKSYTAVFALAGLCIMSSGAIKLFLPTVVKYRNRKLARKH
ncbi:uncharacterized protein LOC6639881 isoform X2 [Drosophila willistoni]|nr:uncharacterized protein LOC6639881 isoform X2 [Drosophila willistoni]